MSVRCPQIGQKRERDHFSDLSSNSSSSERMAEQFPFWVKRRNVYRSMHFRCPLGALRLARSANAIISQIGVRIQALASEWPSNFRFGSRDEMCIDQCTFDVR